MSAFSLNTAFITFFAVVGPPKVLLAYAALAQHRPVAESRKIAALTSLVAALVGILCDCLAPAATTLFHISKETLELAGGIIFFIYAVGLVLGLHLGAGAPHHEESTHPLVSGLREMMMPYVVSPLAVSAVLVESLSKDDWGWRFSVAGAYTAVAALNLVCMLLLTRLLRRAHTTTVEILSRLLGLLLAAVGIQMVINGLTDLRLTPAAGF